MLFNEQTQNIRNNIDQIQDRIDDLEALLKQIRSEKASLEAELQQVLTLEGAAESALNQTSQFLTTARSLGREDLIATFWESMQNFSEPQALLSAGAEPVPDDPDPDAPDAIGVVPVEVVDLPDTPVEALEADIDETSGTNNLDTLGFEELRALAKERGISLKGRVSADRLRKALSDRGLPRAA